MIMNIGTLAYLQAANAVLTSSSYFLHFPKALVQFFKALANFFALEDTSKRIIRTKKTFANTYNHIF